MNIKIVRAPKEDKGAQAKFLDELNPSQREAVVTTEGPLLIVAGAGSGKTRVLTYRVAYLLSKGVAPYSILALTFTNKAAAEMKERISHIAGADTAHKIWAGTFHSIFARILRMEAAELGYTSAFSIYDSDDSLSLIRSIMNTMGISQQQFPPQGIRSKISWAKNQMISWQEYSSSVTSLPEKQAGLVYQEYEKRLRLNNAMDFDDLLLNIIRLFQNNPDVLDKYQERFRYIMVDEYQDTNRAQYIAVRLLAGKYKHLCVVGDDAQSIYRWRGADIRNILDFQKDYPDAKIIRLEQNYRSTKTILAAADSVIRNNSKQIPKTLWTENESGDPIYVLSCRDDREEADSIVRQIEKDMREMKLSPKDFAILYRTNAQSQAIEDALRRSNIPYNIVSGVSFYKRKEVKDTLAYLRLLANPNDGESLMRVVNEPARGLGNTSLNHLRDYAAMHSVSLYTAFREADKNEMLQKRAQTAAIDFYYLISQFIGRKENVSPAELARDFIEATGLLRMYKEMNTDEALDRWNNIQRVLSHIAEYQERDDNPTLEDYLQQIALVSDTDELQHSPNHISLMTMHAAKGLEFPVVLIAGLEQGLFPLSKAETNYDEQEEERRLFYVGITRARKKLYLTHAERRYRFGELSFSGPSMFISEIDEKLLHRRDNYISARMKPSPPPAPKKTSFFDDMPREESYSQIPVDTANIRIGARVRHAMFGEGKVEALAGAGSQQRVQVFFPKVGRKNLMLQYAKLEVLS